MQDAVLRMLVDKYKPLRSGTIQTAEQKLKFSPPSVAPSASGSTPTRFTVPSTGSWATEPLLPSSPDHQPWHTEFKAPSHATSSIREAYIPPVSPRPPKPIPIDDLARRKEREAKKKADYAGRLTRAKESTLDYRLGIKGSASRPRPVTLKGWASLVEDKIEVSTDEFLYPYPAHMQIESPQSWPLQHSSGKGRANSAKYRRVESIHCSGRILDESNRTTQRCCSAVGRSSGW